MKCDRSFSFIQVGRNTTHPIFEKLYLTNICTSRLHEFAILHSQTSWIIQAVSFKSFNITPQEEYHDGNAKPLFTTDSNETVTEWN